MISLDVKIPVADGVMPAYFAGPAGGGKNPVVIVLQEIFGVNTQMRRVTDLLAKTGYAAVAINYYHRTHPDLNVPYTQEGAKIGMGAAASVTRETFAADLAATIAWLQTRDDVDTANTAIWGFCMGGTYAFFSATQPGIKAAVSFYGGQIAAPLLSGGPEMLADAGNIKAPLLLAFGGKDEHITKEHRDRIAAALEAAKKPFDMQVYIGEDHGFFRESSEAFSNPDVMDAWERVKHFLSAHLDRN